MAEASEEGLGSQWAVVPMMMMMMTCILKLRILDNVGAIEMGPVFWVHGYFFFR
jgi:hypothetical protein